MKTKAGVVIILLTLLWSVISCNKEEEPTADPRDVITGKWLCTEIDLGTNEQQVFEVTVNAVPGNSAALDLINFAHTNGIVRGYFEVDKVSIPKQTVNDMQVVGTGYIISAYGSNWDYDVTFEGVKYECYAGFKKKY
ncbi:MAG: hypothetical protein R2750_11585 [Bacteroidales bacterium]